MDFSYLVTKSGQYNYIKFILKSFNEHKNVNLFFSLFIVI